MSEERNHYFLIKALKHIRNSDDAKAQFLSLLSHEIRTPLSVTVGYADLIMSDPSLSTSAKGYVERIKKNSEDLLSAFSTLMESSKAQDSFEFEGLEHFNIQHLLKEISQQAEGVQEFVKIKLLLPSTVPKVIVSSPNLLKKIISLLLIIGFRKKSQSVFLEVLPVESSGVNSLKLKFSVKFQSDRPKMDIERELEFILGAELVRSLNSRLFLEEKSGKFDLHFTALVSYPVQQEFPFLNNAGANLRLDSLKILLIEDSLDQQILIRKILQKEGAEVTIAHNGLEGIDLVTKEDFDIILTDIRMPGIDGFETSLRLRQKGWRKPIIAITAHDLHSERERALLNNIDDFQLKPVNQNQIVQSILKFKTKYQYKPSSRELKSLLISEPS